MSNKINVSVDNEVFEINKGITYRELSDFVYGDESYKNIVALQNNKLVELSREVINYDNNIKFLGINDKDGMRVYHRTLSLVMVCAVKKILGDKAPIIIEHSINKNLYCEIRIKDFKINDSFIEKLKNKMFEYIEKDSPIIKRTYRKSEAENIVKKFDMNDKSKVFDYRKTSNVNLYELDGFYDYYYGYMAPSAGYVKLFDIKPYENGFIIIMPNENNIDELNQFVDYKKISSVFIEQMNWINLMGVDNVSDLNDVIVRGHFNELVLINEALHEKKIAEIADMINKKRNDIKVIMIAGPSSSGKTTFAQRLMIQLRVNGIRPHIISMDNYFVNRDLIPFDENGKKDFENLNTLDVELFNSDLSRLINGETVELPNYNFITGSREYKGNFKKLNDGEIFVIEGIHGLNDAVTTSIPEKNKFKIFISAMTQLNIDNHNRVSTSDSRLIRRIVRDHQFRGTSAKETIGTWDYVTRGEKNNIFPFQENADVIFNSATVYELAVLKTYIEPLLFNIDRLAPEYITAERIIKFLDYFIGVNSDIVPKNAILKEFLGGSCFDV